MQKLTTLTKTALAKLIYGRYADACTISEAERRDVKRAIADYEWPKWAVHYHGTQVPRYCATLQYVGEVPENLKVLEIGSMPYLMAVILKERHGSDIVACTSEEVRADTGFNVIPGPDPDAPHTIEIPRRDGGAPARFPQVVFNAELVRWPFEDDSFDLVMMCEVFEHFAHDPMAVVAEANRTLKPGGHLFLTTPNVHSFRALRAMLGNRTGNMCPEFNVDSIYYRHNREYSPAELGELARAGGFEVELLETFSLHRPSLGSPLRAIAMRMADPNTGDRGNFVVMRARKTGAVTERYPQALQLYAK